MRAVAQRIAANVERVTGVSVFNRGLLVLVMLLGLTPLAVREVRRQRRLHLVGGGGPDAVCAAWEEVLAESADRGVVLPVSETVRATARRLADEHALDEPGQVGLHTPGRCGGANLIRPARLHQHP